MFRVLKSKLGDSVYGTIRSNLAEYYFKDQTHSQLAFNIDVTNFDDLIKIFYTIKPSVVINCIGLTKHKEDPNNVIETIQLNSLFPHQLYQLCNLFDARLIHISTDCVFSGKKGMYRENDQTDAIDIYGKSKALGELINNNSVTLRTSTIGHEINSNYGLLNWFLSQEGSCKGFSKAIFSGLPTVVFAEIVHDYVLDNKSLTGLYHVAASPINKYDLLMLISKIYKKNINIELDGSFLMDRSLDYSKFHLATGYKAPNWEFLIKTMHNYN